VVVLFRSLAREQRTDLTLALMLASPRSIVVLTSIFFDKTNADETGRAQALYYAICDKTQEAGYQQYRTSTAYMERILRSAPEFQQLAQRIKGALDPQGILAPGKYGIR
jgi:4-cresol dehydrogenase (hydroxylating)